MEAWHHGGRSGRRNPQRHRHLDARHDMVAAGATKLWCHARPAHATARLQGWKLHLSATPQSAPVVLARAIHILRADPAAFKFARTTRLLADLIDARQDRGSGGKFLTIYPVDDEQCRRLAHALDEATHGLPGPGVLSDQRLRPGSLVHLRYGAFEACAR
ncbi:hypothetical protein V2I01_17690 [Micromonospora sp. BRA006-A]|nr:hypothetical protein [Micromonospora sp. BRA006-A]